MTIESLNQDLAQLERDVRALSKDAARLAGDVGTQVRTVEEEAVAAEFIATEEAIENVSGILSALSEIRAIQREQLRTFFADHRETAREIVKLRTPFDALRLGFSHWERRATHVASGVTGVAEVLAKEGRHLSTSMVEMWKPFFQLVRGDWTRG